MDFGLSLAGRVNLPAGMGAVAYFTIAAYLAGSASNFSMQDLQHNCTSLPTCVTLTGSPMLPSFSPETTQVVSGLDDHEDAPVCTAVPKSAM